MPKRILNHVSALLVLILFFYRSYEYSEDGSGMIIKVTSMAVVDSKTVYTGSTRASRH